MLPRRMPLLVAATAAALAIPTLVVPAYAATPCDLLTTTVYARVNTTTQGQLLTTSSSEATKSASTGFTFDGGTPFKARGSAKAGLIAVNRLYKARTYDFMYVPAGAEVTSLVAAGYTDQGVNFYTYDAAQSCTAGVQRFVKNGIHRYTVSSTDAAALTAAGWTFEKVAFHVLSTLPPAPSTTSATPTPTPTPTATPTSASPTPTPTPTPSPTETTASATPTPTETTANPTVTESPTNTNPPSATPTPTPTETTANPTVTESPTNTNPPSATASPTAASDSPTATPTSSTASATPTATPTPTPTPTPTLPTPTLPNGSCSALTGAVYYRLDPKTLAGLLTTSLTEATNAGKYGYTVDAGIPFKAAKSASAGLVEFRRYYAASTTDFIWLAAGSTVPTGYVDQGINWFAYAAAQQCTAPVYRFLKSNHHRYALGAAGYSALIADGWVAEGAAFHAVDPNATVNPTPTPTATATATATPTSTATASASPTASGSPSPTPTPTLSQPNDGIDHVFSLAWLPDTQNETTYGDKTRFAQRTQWLVNNRQALDLRFVGHVGDVVNWGWLDATQFTIAKNAIANLENAGIPYTLGVGNHDSAAVDVGGSAYIEKHPNAPDPSVSLRDTTAFNSVFIASRFGAVGGVFEAGKVDNLWSSFTAGGKNWLVLDLELWPRQAALDWGKGVVASHPNFNVIVNTHAFLEADGSISQNSGGYGALTPQQVYDQLISQYPNIVMVTSGHTGQATSRTLAGANGTKVLALLETYHSDETNPTRLIQIDTANGMITTQVYAPLTNQYFADGESVTQGMTFVNP